MSELSFSKMHGLGNDFMVIDLVSQSLGGNPIEAMQQWLSAKKIQQLADRHFGIGFDQLLIVEPPSSPSSDFCYRIFNADGAEVENCGNGARCFALFVQQQGLTRKNHLLVETLGGLLELQVLPNNQVQVSMGEPSLRAEDLPFLNEHCQPQDSPQWELSPFKPGMPSTLFTPVSMGNPHAVIIVDDLDNTNVEEIGVLIQQHPAFPQSVNVGFMQIINRQQIRLRVYERGSGETLACGTGACAAVVAGQHSQLLDSTVTVILRGGELSISHDSQKPGQPVLMTGPAETVYHGTISMNK